MPKQLFCVVCNDGGGPGIPGDGAYLVPYRDIALVVKESPSVDYASLSRDILVRQLASHQSLIEGLMDEHTVVPIKFGTSAADDGELLEILESGYPGFKKAVDTMAGKVEVDLIALWNDLDSMLKELGERDEIRRFREGIDPASPEKLREQAVELGKMVRTALEEENNRLRDEIVTSMSQFVLGQRVREHFDDRMLMNVAFLIRREEKIALDEWIEELDSKYEGTMNFRIIGPLPPHSFSTLEIRRVGAREMEDAMRMTGVKAGAGPDELRQSYRKLLRSYHPDKNPDDPGAQERFEKFNEAYRTLADCHLSASRKDAIMVRVLR
ncbi:MAG: GvpL/GvpF family gas vesicle protein [Geobacter sp.]|nr:GvpL/GvpF family gas vesicle protein [Geobacter sp.]